jgi:hypothetical protein
MGQIMGRMLAKMDSFQEETKPIQEMLAGM